MGRRSTEIRKGNVLEIEGELWLVLEFDHNQPGKGRAIISVKLKNLRTGQTRSERYSSGDVVEFAFLETRKCQYLYRDQTTSAYVFMDQENYEQYELTGDVLGETMNFVVEEHIVDMTFHDGNPLSVDLPGNVNLRITESEPAARGDTVSNVFKKAVVETGLEIKVPLHIDVGELVKVSTQTGDFQGRAKE